MELQNVNQTLPEKARNVLSNARLWDRTTFWAKVVSTTCYLVNRSPHTSIDFQIPEEVWLGNPVDYSIFRIFRCPMFAHVNNGKLAPMAVKCMFLGYASESKEYWYPDSKKVIQNRDVTFNENAMLFFGKESVVSSAGTGD